MTRLNIFKKAVLGVLAVAIGVMATPVSEHGRLSISGFNVVDKNTNPYVLRGMSFFWNNWAGSFYNSSVVSTLASTGTTGWGANVIRAAISNFDVSTAKNMIDYANSNGIYVIIDNHSHCAHKDLSNANNFFSQVAQYVKQKNYVHVMYEVFNEPVKAEGCSVTNPEQGSGTIAWSTIKTYAESVIATIRKYDDGIVFVGTPNYSAATESARQNPITKYSNIAYSLHFYASQVSHKGYQDNLIKAKCNDFPVFITEWGTSEANGKGTVNPTMNNSWMSLVETIGVGWANWSIYDKDESSAALKSGVGSNGSWNDNQLSTSGTYVRKIMKSRNAGGALSTVGLSTTTYDCNKYKGPTQSEFVRTGVVDFGYAFQAEDYKDSSNVRTVSVASARNGMVMQTESSSQQSALMYEFKDAPTDAGYYRIQLGVSTNESGTIYYSLNDGATLGSVTYEPTGSEYVTLKGLLSVPANSSLNLKVYWTGNVTVDNFFVGGLTQSDSVSFGVLEVDEDGNHISKDPAGVIDGSGVQAISFATAPKPVSVALQGRNLEVYGVDASATVDVMDMQGRLLMKASVVPGASLNLGHLRAGSYVIRVKSLGSVYNQRVMLK